MLRVTLKSFLPDREYELLSKSSIDLTRRPEELSIQEFVELSNTIETMKKGV